MNFIDYLTLILTTLLGGFLIYKIFFDTKNYFNPFNWFFAFSLLYICAGALFTMLTSQQEFKDELLSNYEIGPMDTFLTSLTLLLFNFVLYVVLKLAKKVNIDWFKYWKETEFNIKENPIEYYVVLAISLLVQLAAIAKGDLGLEGVQLDYSVVSIGYASPLGLISNWLSVGLPAFCVFLIFNTKKYKFIFFLIFIWTVLISLIMGRRVMISSCALAMIPFFIYYTNTRKRFIILLIISAFSFIGSIGFYFLRIANWQLFAYEEKKDLTSIISFATELASGKQSAVAQGIKTDAINNITTRTFNIGYFNLVREYSFNTNGAGGEILYYSILGVMPGFLFPSKHEITWRGGEEGITNQYLATKSNRDENNSILTAALADFGYIGIFIYSIVFGLLLIVSCIMFRFCRGSAWALLAILHFFWTLSYFETQFVGYFIAFRFQVFLCVLGLISSVLYRKSKFRQNRSNFAPSHPLPPSPRGSRV